MAHRQHQEADQQLGFAKLEETQKDMVQRLDRLINRVGRIEGRLNNDLKELIMDLSRLAASVKKIDEVVPSVVELMNRLSKQLKDVADDPDEVNAFAQQLSEKADVLAQAVAANTAIQAPAPNPEPVEPTPNPEMPSEPPAEPIEPLAEGEGPDSGERT